jgi:hypothetical protein
MSDPANPATARAPPDEPADHPRQEMIRFSHRKRNSY